MADESHPDPPADDDAVVDIDGSTLDDATATEETPLLSSSSSATLRNGISPPNGPRPRAASTGSNVATHTVGWVRGVAVGASLFLLIFIQGTHAPSDALNNL